MDKLKGMAEKAMHSESSSNTNTGAADGAANTSGAGNQDYLDKGVAQAEKSMGMQQNTAMNEKITDAGRGFYEKETGSKVNSKISN